jgi:hypothetical protein
MLTNSFFSKILIVVLAFLFIIPLFIGCEKAAKPTIHEEHFESAPDFHKPRVVWTSTHMDKLKKQEPVIDPFGDGKSMKPLSIEMCKGCHEENGEFNFCNKCHSYVGVKKISAK